MEDKEKAIELLTEALHACQDAKFSRAVLETVCAAIDNAYDEIEGEE